MSTEITTLPHNGKLKVVSAFGLFGLGALGLVFGGFPIWAARRVLYPPRPGLQSATPSGFEIVPDVGPGVHSEKVEFDSLSGYRLSGWFVPGPNPTKAPWPTILLVYGYGSYKEQMAPYARIVREGGFASLMFDMEGSGLRHGRPVTLGAKESLDFEGAARYLRTRSDVDPARLGALGVSMGAATALLGAAKDGNIKAIVSDSGYADIADMIKPGLQAFVGRGSLFLAPLIVRYAEAMIGAKASDIVPSLAASHLGKTAMLLIHGVDDGQVSAESADRIYEVASGPKELWIVPDCRHADAPNVAPEEYKQRVNGFFSKWLHG